MKEYYPLPSTPPERVAEHAAILEDPSGEPSDKPQIEWLAGLEPEGLRDTGAAKAIVEAAEICTTSADVDRALRLIRDTPLVYQKLFVGRLTSSPDYRQRLACVGSRVVASWAALYAAVMVEKEDGEERPLKYTSLRVQYEALMRELETHFVVQTKSY